MPEGPEIRVISESVHNLLAGATLGSVQVVAGKTKSGQSSKFENIEGINEFTKALPLRLNSVKCKGKFIYFEFQNINKPKKRRWYLWNNLGMTGTWKTQPSTHNKVLFKFIKDEMDENGQIQVTPFPIYFRDQRHFGLLRFMRGSAPLKRHLNSLGPDLLNSPNDTPVNRFIKHFQKYSTHKIGGLLMDQYKISGVGNYLRAEILYRSKINPDRKVSDLSTAELTAIYHQTQTTMLQSYNSQGLHIKDYTGGIEDDKTDKDGLRLDNNPDQFELMVYARKTDPLGNTVKTKKDKTGRTIHWVPEVQE
jgi:formamidopyrimidine-DNA glycosylase